MEKQKTIRIYDTDYEPILNYPFKSKYKYLPDSEIYKTTIPKEPYVPDYKLKSCKALSKPNFSLEPGCWEADLMFAKYYILNSKSQILTKKTQIYLVMINVNTRYLIVEPIKDKSTYEIGIALQRIIDETQFNINTIKCDGEKGFEGLINNTVILHWKQNLNEDDRITWNELREDFKKL